MADKDYEFIASKISEIAECVYCITPENPRALNCHDYKAVYEKMGVMAICDDDKERLIFSMLERAKKEKKIVLCLGSLYMYGEIKQIVNKFRPGLHRPPTNAKNGNLTWLPFVVVFSSKHD
jgi:folylpolyglutamate synthase/dihydropteroate synthase